MNRTRKIIVMFLALILLSLNVTGLAYYTGDVAESESPKAFETAVNTLYGLGVLPSNSTGGYEDTVTKAEFTEYVNNFGGNNIQSPAEPDADITMGEAVKMLVEMSNNVTLAEYYGTYPTGYFVLADRMGISYGLKGVQEYDKITYAMAVQMLYNTLRVTPGVVDTVTSGGKTQYEYDAGRTVLTEYLEVKYLSGFVTADDFWSLNPGTLPSEDGLVIDGEMFKLKYPATEDYVGFIVNYFYHEEDDVILAVEKSSKSSQVILRGSNITDFRNNTYTYEVDGKEEEYDLDADMSVIYNYVPDLTLKTGSKMWPANGDVVLVDADGNRKYETVLIKTYDEIAIQAINIEGEKLISDKGEIYEIKKDTPINVYYNGKKVTLADVKSGLHATVVYNTIGTQRHIREIYLSDKKVKGTIQSYEYDDRRKTVTIDGTMYTVSNSSKDSNIAMGTAGTFTLNYKGEIVSVDMSAAPSSASGKSEFGYLIKMRRFEFDDKEYSLKLLTEKGEVVTYYLDPDCKINRHRIKSNEDARSYFAQADGTFDPIKRQVIIYALNEEGLISKIETATDETSVKLGDYKFHKTYETSKPEGTFYSEGSFENKVLIGADTVMFSVPEDETQESEGSFRVDVGIKSHSRQKVVAYAYEKNASVADVLVVKSAEVAGTGEGGPSSAEPNIVYDELQMVTGVKLVYNDEHDHAFYMIDCMSMKTGNISTKILSENAKYYCVAKDKTGTVSSDSNYTNGATKMLQAGDLFHYTVNSLGAIGGVFKHYDAAIGDFVKGIADDGNVIDYSVDVRGPFYSGAQFHMGYPITSSAEYVTIGKSPSDTLNSSRDNLLTFLKKDTITKVWTVSVNGSGTRAEAKGGSLESIIPAINGDRRAVVYAGWSLLNTVVVYEQ